MITCANEAHEEGDVACYDTPGVYLHTMNDEGVITFRSNIKYLLLKLLCTLALLCEGTPLKHLDLTSLESELSITIAISNFLRVGQTEQGDRRAEPTSALRSPTIPPPQPPPPLPTYHLSPAGVSSRRAISRCRAQLGECLPYVARNIFSMHSPCFPLCYFRKSP